MSTPGAGPRVSAALTTLRDRGERVTQARRSVLEVLDGTEEHLTADEIANRAAARTPGVHRATVYRALSTLGALGLVTHTHVGGSATVFHLSGLGSEDKQLRHAHLQCTSCGVVIDVAAEAFGPLASRLRQDIGFDLDPQHAALLGTCATCRANESANAPDRTEGS